MNDRGSSGDSASSTTSSGSGTVPIWADSPFVAAAIGQLSGMAGNGLIHPLDTIKSRLQARGPADPATASATLARMLKSEGPKALTSLASAAII
eukprot:scaffold242328_cov45-Prasinocladus_malaysianus.AAC.1